jgi:flagellar L-ring protein precursor FlgH
MKYRIALLTILLVAVLETGADGDSMWLRRDPNLAYLFYDTRARRVGDVLTIAVRENTSFDGMERRQLEKDTKAAANWAFKGAFSQGKSLNHSFATSFNGEADSTRQLNGTANNSIDRKFTDQMAVLVIDVMPNGNLVIEGYRRRVVAKEERTLHVKGIVRPQDIGPGNIIQSQFIADLAISYEGRGQESAYQDNGWLGKIMNVLWPF